MIMRSIRTLALACAAGLILTSATQGAVLDDLLAGDTITNGDKLFSNFSYTPIGDMPTADNVVVNAWTDPDGNLGLIFIGAFTDYEGNGASEVLITYDVTVTDDSLAITGANVAGDISVDPANGGFGSVTETFLPESNLVLSIFNNPGGEGEQLSDSGDFENDMTTLHVQKNILLDAGAFAQTAVNGNDGAATMTFVWQTFNQGPRGGGEPVIPEPAALGLLSLGALSLVRRR